LDAQRESGGCGARACADEVGSDAAAGCATEAIPETGCGCGRAFSFARRECSCIHARADRDSFRRASRSDTKANIAADCHGRADSNGNSCCYG
jgi:hypothetical protein